MRNIRKNNSGITLIALTVTIIVMIILATIGINSGKEIIKKSKIQTLQTNMLQFLLHMPLLLPVL